MIVKVIFIVFGISIIFATVYLILLVRQTLRKTFGPYGSKAPDDSVSLREFPYHFKCAFTLFNDVDETESLSEFLTIQKFLN